MSKPVKPKYYKVRLYVPIVGFVIFMWALNLIDSNTKKVIFGLISLCIALVFQHLFNPKNVNEYYQHEIDIEKKSPKNITSKSNINENIRKHLEEQRIKKQNAKWWQFWV